MWPEAGGGGVGAVSLPASLACVRTAPLRKVNNPSAVLLRSPKVMPFSSSSSFSFSLVPRDKFISPLLTEHAMWEA